MTNEDIIRMALDAHLLNYVDLETPRRYFIPADAGVEEVERFAALVAAAEREACLKICDDWSGGPFTKYAVVEAIADDIRERGKQEQPR